MKNRTFKLSYLLISTIIISSISTVTTILPACHRYQDQAPCNCCKYDQLSFAEKQKLGFSCAAISEMNKQCLDCRAHRQPISVNDRDLPFLKDQVHRAQREVQLLRDELRNINCFCFFYCDNSSHLRRVRYKQEDLARAEESLARAQEQYARALKTAIRNVTH
jgi:hypothetical protein